MGVSGQQPTLTGDVGPSGLALRLCFLVGCLLLFLGASASQGEMRRKGINQGRMRRSTALAACERAYACESDASEHQMHLRRRAFSNARGCLLGGAAGVGFGKSGAAHDQTYGLQQPSICSSAQWPPRNTTHAQDVTSVATRMEMPVADTAAEATSQWVSLCGNLSRGLARVGTNERRY